MPRNEPLKDPVALSEAQARGEVKPHDHIADAEAQTRHSIAEWEKRQNAGELHGHETAPAPEAPAPVGEPEPAASEPATSEPAAPQSRPWWLPKAASKQENPDAA